MKKTAENLKVRHLPCFAHCLNLTAQDAFSVESFCDILSKCKAIVTFFRSSTLATDTLRSIQRRTNSPELKLIQQVETRWNSAYYMLKRVFELRMVLAMAMNECPRAPAPLTAENFDVIKEIMSLLEPFEIATVNISGETYVTSSVVIPLIRGIIMKLTEFRSKLTTREGKEVHQKLLDSTTERLTPFYKRSTTRLATILDPRFKKHGFTSPQDADNAAQLLQKEYTSHLAWVKSRQRHTAQTSSSTDPREQAQTSTSSTRCVSKLDELLFLFPTNNPTPVSTPVSDSIIDIRQYLEKPPIGKNSSVLDYWSNSTSMLRDLATKYLCTPATSVPAERIFSKAGNIMTDKRNRLKDKNLNTLIFLNQNMPLFE